MVMPVILAAIWHPRGEMGRFSRALPVLRSLYGQMVIVVPGQVEPADLRAVREVAAPYALLRTSGWERARTTALEAALAVEGDVIHAIDMDRLLHWVDTYLAELEETVATMTGVDCLITGRTARAFATHPRAMQETEDLANLLACSLLRTTGLDVCAGSRGLSRRAAGLLLRHTDGPVWGDVSWPVLLHRFGYHLQHVAAEGLEWETPDHFRETVATPAERQAVAAEVDRDPAEWARRVDVAGQILAEGLAAAQAPLRE